MRKVFLDDLPRWEEGSRYAGKIKWSEVKGHKINFIYDDVEGEFEILNFISKGRKLTLKYKDSIGDISDYVLLNGGISKLIGKYTNDYLFSIGEIITELNNGKLKILDQVRKGKYKVRTYEYKCVICDYEGSIAEGHLKNKKGCPVCSGRKTLKRYNDIGTTHPQFIKYFLNENEAYEFSHGSEKVVKVKCQNCDSVKNRSVKDLIRNGIACNACSDNTSYPEKFMFNFLQQLNIEFETQFNTEWSKQKRYDFYIPSLNCIIETHGEQHYVESFKYKGKRSRALNEEQENDRLKEGLARKNGIENYIVIDCRYSELEWIKKSTLESELNIMFNVSQVRWKDCHEFACNGRIKEASELWMSGVQSTVEIGAMMNINCNTARAYLKKGRELGWNTYSEYESTVKGGKSRIKKIICLNTLEIFNGTKEILDKYGIHRSSVTNMCNNLDKVNYILYNSIPLVFMFYIDYKNNVIDVKHLLQKAYDSYDRKGSKKIICLNTSEIFENVTEAGKKYNIPYQSITSCCKNKYSYAGTHIDTKEKLVWMYKEDYEKYIEEIEKEN